MMEGENSAQVSNSKKSKRENDVEISEKSDLIGNSEDDERNYIKIVSEESRCDNLNPLPESESSLSVENGTNKEFKKEISIFKIDANVHKDEKELINQNGENVLIEVRQLLEHVLYRVEEMSSLDQVSEDESIYLCFRQMFIDEPSAGDTLDNKFRDSETPIILNDTVPNKFKEEPLVQKETLSTALCDLKITDSLVNDIIEEDLVANNDVDNDESISSNCNEPLEDINTTLLSITPISSIAVNSPDLPRECPIEIGHHKNDVDLEVMSSTEESDESNDRSAHQIEITTDIVEESVVVAETNEISVFYGPEESLKTAEAGYEGSSREEQQSCTSEGSDLKGGVSLNGKKSLSEDPPCSLEMLSSEVKGQDSMALNQHSGKESFSGISYKRKLPLQRAMRSLSFSSALKFGKSEVASLVEKHLQSIYIPFESVKTQLVRQCRDILLCEYQGDFQKFKDLFLVRATSLLLRLKSVFPNSICVCQKARDSLETDNPKNPTCLSCEGWPLCYNNGRLIVHIGEIDEAFLKPGDFYICVKESTHDHESVSNTSSHREIYLSFRYRRRKEEAAKIGEEVIEHRVDDTKLGFLFNMDWLESSESESMIAEERLTTVLQHLLLSVERGIERLEWDSVGKLWQSCSLSIGQGSRCCHSVATNTKDSSVQTSSPDDDLTQTSENTDVKGSNNIPCSGGYPSNISGICSPTLELGPCLNGYYEGAFNHGKLSKHELPILRLPCSSPVSAEEEPDDGYYDHTLPQPTTLNQVDQDLLCSEVALLPGSRDSCGRSIVVISGSAIKDHASVSASHLAQLLLYFHTIPKNEVISRGFLILIDAHGANDQLWNILDETFCLLEANVANALSQVLLFSPSVKSTDVSKFFPMSRIQCEVVNTYEKLLTFIRKDQLLICHDGDYVYDHQEWISFRKFLEPFINGCYLSGRNLKNLLDELRICRVPASSSLTHQLIEKQKKSVQLTFQDEQIRHLQDEGDTVLKELESYKTRSPQNADYRDNLERTSNLYEKLKKAILKLPELADRRLQRLEECLQLRTFQEESSQVLSWLCRKGTESLDKHQGIADSLGDIKEQEEEFEKFYFLAMRQIERGNDLLEEASTLFQDHSVAKSKEDSAPDDGAGVQELASSLRQHLGSFSEKLEGTRERIEDTAKCYQLMDKSYEWALEAMRFVSQLGLVNSGNSEGIIRQIRCLQDYLEDHLPISEEVFQETIDLAVKLGNNKLVEQCKIAKLRCQETVDLIQARQLTLLKLKQQIEVDSLRSPVWDGDDSAPTPRTSRSHSQPVNLWMPPGSNGSYPLSLGHFRRCSDTSAISSAPQNYGSPIGSYTSFPSSYYPTAKDSYHIDSYIQNQKEDQLLQRGLITEDLTYQGPVTSISKGYLDCRLSNKDNNPSSSSSSSSSNSSKAPVSVLRSSGRGTYSVNTSGGVNLRWNRKHTKKSQSWQVRDETLEKIKNEVKEQNALLQVEKLHSSLEGSDDSTHSTSETDFSPTSENGCKVPHSNTRSDPQRGPVPVNTHLLNQSTSSDTPDSGGGNLDSAQDAVAKTKKTLMLIMKEMIQTERDYVNSLEYIIENYIPELLREDIPQALRGQRNVVFGNIEKIYEFHSQYFLSELELCENTPFVVGQCFLKYEPQFYLYALYNKNKPKSDALMIEYGNTFFRKKQLELEDKMDLASYLLKPVQRMGKYALLLKQLLKECPEREAEHQDLKVAEEMVRFQLRHGNDLLAMDALRDCDVNVKEQGRLLRQDEFLVWQGRSRKSLRHVFLFEDLILFSKARRDPQRKGYEMYQYKQSIKTTDMGLTEQVGDSPTKFEIWFRKRKLNDTYLLQAPNPDVKAAWVHELSKLLWKQALRNREMRLAEMSSMGIGNKPCLDIKPTEDQIRDRSISIHQLARAPRFRNSMGMPPYDVKSAKRPHSIISVSSSSSSGSSQSSFTFYGTLNLGFEPGDSPPRPLHRSLTQQSQCSTESGFCTDASTVGDSPTDSDQIRHKKAERSDSLLSSDSLSTSTTPSELNCSPCEENIIEETLTTSM